MSSAVVEVVLGLVFVFFLFSMLCSGINELISRVMGKRADFLTLGVWRLLEHSGTDDEERARYFTRFWQHPLVRALGPPAPAKAGGPAPASGPDQASPPEPSAPSGKAAPGSSSLLARAWARLCAWTRGRLTSRQMKAAMATMPYEPRELEGARLRPSYIPAETFATVVLDLLREDRAALAAPSQSGEGEAPASGPGGAAPSPLTRAVDALAAGTGDDARRLRASLERWYDAQMERVSGWYKRESKRMLLWLGAVVVLALNVDTISITRTLWSDPSTRRAVAAAADQQLAAAATTTVVSPAGRPPAAPAPALSCPDSGAAAGTATTTAGGGYGDAVAEAIDCARSLPLPIGWRVPDTCRNPGRDQECGFGDRVGEAWDSVEDAGVTGSILKLVGWGLTIGALTFGAPFWFDLLNRFGSLRGAGTKPKSTGET